MQKWASIGVDYSKVANSILWFFIGVGIGVGIGVIIGRASGQVSGRQWWGTWRLMTKML
jgi:hypothetical protein